MEGEFQKQQTGAARKTDPESVIDALILDRQGDKRQDWYLGDSTEGYMKRGAFWTQRLEKKQVANGHSEPSIDSHCSCPGVHGRSQDRGGELKEPGLMDRR